MENDGDLSKKEKLQIDMKMPAYRFGTRIVTLMKRYWLNRLAAIQSY